MCREIIVKVLIKCGVVALEAKVGCWKWRREVLEK